MLGHRVKVNAEKENMASTKQIMAAEARKMTGATVGIPPRNVQFVMPEGGDGLLYDDNLMVSALFAVLSAGFPPGERFFVDAVRHFKDSITDPHQRAEVSGFMGQESVHGRQHARLNDWLSERGLRTDIADRLLGLSLRLMRRRSPTEQLALTAAAEHFTAEFAMLLMQDEDFQAKTPDDFLGIWMWHALEELEHKSVAFDLHAQVSPDAQRERFWALRFLPLVIGPTLVMSWACLVLSHPRRFELREHRRGLRDVFGESGLFTRIQRRMSRFASRGFHPSQQDTNALEDAWRERLFGESGELLDVFKNRDAVRRAYRRPEVVAAE